MKLNQVRTRLLDLLYYRMAEHGLELSYSGSRRTTLNLEKPRQGILGSFPWQTADDIETIHCFLDELFGRIAC